MEPTEAARGAFSGFKVAEIIDAFFDYVVYIAPASWSFEGSTMRSSSTEGWSGGRSRGARLPP